MSNQKPIRIFDKTLTFLGEISNYESLYFERSWFDIGVFKLQINLNKINTEFLTKGNFIVIGKDYNKIGQILQIELPLDQSGKISENLLITGREAKTILNRITIPPVGNEFDAYTNTASETIMKQIINKNSISATDSDRDISILSLETDQVRGILTDFSTRYNNLKLDISTLAKFSGLGWNINLDTAVPDLEVVMLEGLDRTSAQSTNSFAKFSPDFGNIQTQQYFNSDVNYRNVAVVGGDGEGVARTIRTVGTDTGIDRKEVFVDARGLTTNDELDEKGAQALADFSTQIGITSEILTKGNLIYETDYDLGDIVEVENKKLNVLESLRIIQIAEVYDPDRGFFLEATFGERFPNLSDVLKQQFSNLQSVSNV